MVLFMVDLCCLPQGKIRTVWLTFLSKCKTIICCISWTLAWSTLSFVMVGMKTGHDSNRCFSLTGGEAELVA